MQLRMIIFATLALFAASSAEPIVGGKLEIDFTVKNNNNKLRNKTSPSYQILKDGYAPTIWIEGPYDPAVPCEIKNFERQNIKLTKSIVHFGKSHARVAPFAEKRNPWAYADYRTADYRAALITAGKYRHYSHDPMTWPDEAMDTGETFLAPIDSRRTETTNGAMFCDSTTSVIGHYPVGTLKGRKFLGTVSGVDGISSATVYADSADSSVSYQWDMTNDAGTPIEEGWYLVTVMLSAERFPRKMEGDTIVKGLEQVDLETCWDNALYDTLGHHRVTNLYHFTKDSSFTLVENKERKWKGDPYNYFSGAVTFRYSAPQITTVGSSEKNSRGSSIVNIGNHAIRVNGEITHGTPVQLFSVQGKKIAELQFSKNHDNKFGSGIKGGCYFVKYSSSGTTHSQRILVQ